MPKKKQNLNTAPPILLTFGVLFFTLCAIAQPSSFIISGTVNNKEDHKPLPGATISKHHRTMANTDAKGQFAFTTNDTSGILNISFIGFKTIEFPFNQFNHGPFRIELETASTIVNEVNVYTGYQALPKERATGSFVQIDNALINRSVGPNILDRLNGITSGLLFNGQASTNVSTNPSNRILGINIRGESTLSGNVSRDPLIVLDNFPYEGNIDNINPNDIASITVLKDAAAASIWGARSGNGVIVITTKKGKKNQALRVELSSSVSVQSKPNLKYDRNYLDASDYINVESDLFKQGYFDSYLTDTQNQPPVTPVVDILAKLRAGTLSQQVATSQINALRGNDVRDDYRQYIYQKAVKQQYAIGLRGGTEQDSYTFSAGYDKNQDNMVRNGFDRITVNALNTYTPVKNLEITTGINYSENTTDQNNQLYWGNGITVGGPVAGIYPYARFADANGNPLAIVKDYSANYANHAQAIGLLDWSYRPLNELRSADNYTKVNDLLLKADVKYKFTSHLNIDVQYQNERQVVNTHNYQNAETYAARNLINQFTVIDPVTGKATYQVPYGGLLNLGNYELSSNNLRGQLNFQQSFNTKHSVTAIAGAELRQLRSDSYIRNSYGYNDQFGTSVGNLDYADYLNINPYGVAQIPTPDGTVSGTVNRYVSYFANGAYTYDNRYTLSLSGRKDGANIFGVKTNDKVTPLWSSGLGWNISNEKFYRSAWLPLLKARFSYGFNGNVYNGSAYVTGNYLTSSLTGAPAIRNLTAPNPDLRWEKVRNINAGIDFATKGNRISGTIELYSKNGEDLIESIPLYTSSGFLSYYGNAASTSTHGFDITLNSKNLEGKFKWGSTLLLSTLHDKVTQYNAQFSNTSLQQLGGMPVVGKPLYGIYSYKWAGLDPQNGDPRGYLNGKVSKDYAGIIANYKPDSLAYSGSGRPTVYGAFRNDWSYHHFSLSVNITYELGYYFRRSSTSINEADIISTSFGQNVDYGQRWKKPGDENNTNVPSILYPSNPSRSTFYQYAQTLVDKADNIRLQDIRLSYDLMKSSWHRLPFRDLQLYAYASNLGILWRANHDGIDPDIPSVNSHGYPSPLTIALGFNAHF